MWDLIHILLYAVFFLSSFILIVVVLLQESKGGGLAEAFGGTGAETFGVRAGGINRFTFYVAGAFMLSAVLIHPVSLKAQHKIGGSQMQDKQAPATPKPTPGTPSNQPVGTRSNNSGTPEKKQ